MPSRSRPASCGTSAVSNVCETSKPAAAMRASASSMRAPWHNRDVPAQLHTERIGNGRLLLLTHGIYGAGANWRAIAKKLVAQRPEWGVLLVDLRQHGRSESGESPHTIAAAADDLRAV